VHLKNSLTSSGIEIVTFRLVTLVPQSLRYRVPPSLERGLLFTLVLEEEYCFIFVGRTDILLMYHDLEATLSALSWTASGLQSFRTKSNCFVCGRVTLTASTTVGGKVKKWHGMSSRMVMYDNVTCVSPASLALRAILRRFASRRVVTCTTLHSNVPQHLLPHKSVRIPTTAKLFKLLQWHWDFSALS
jgi:hypothetical protein